MTTLPLLTADLTFDAASALVLDYLRDHVPLALWGVTRVENDRQTFLTFEDSSYGFGDGASHPWQDSFCIHMASGAAPAIAPDAQSVPLYAAAGVNQLVPIASYAGAVISEPDGELFGAICGIDPKVRTDDPAFVAAGPLLQLLGQLLSMVLAAERQRDRVAGALLLAQIQAESDALTGLYNRHAWERVIAAEESRFKRVADPTVAVILDLDMLKSINDLQGHAAGDAYIRTAAHTLRRAVRERDVVARLGGDEFGVLMVDCTEVEADIAIERIYEAFEAAGVAGSVGWAPITVLKGFPAALAEADAAMYAAKAERRARRASLAPDRR